MEAMIISDGSRQGMYDYDWETDRPRDRVPEVGGWPFIMAFAFHKAKHSLPGEAHAMQKLYATTSG